MNPAFVIERKRDGAALSADEIAAFVGGYARGDVPDYQMAALAMAVFFRGMNPLETTELTRHMLLSGQSLRWPADGVIRADKHSTGGIGDKVSLILAPLLACCGLQVPMVSGRGLGPTGGTLDKLEAIPGFRCDLTSGELQEVCQRVGCAITGATAELAPADRRLYALRDVTGTVPSIPLITASILSKKLAAGLDALVMDVKWGSGAFMRPYDQACALAQSLVAVGGRLGLKTTALVTDMNQPLGRMAGHTVEVIESVETLQGRGPDDLREVTLALGAELLLSTGKAGDRASARALLEAPLADGRGLAKFREMVRAQGGDPEAALPIAPEQVLLAPREGRLAAIETSELGRAITLLGGGRQQLGDRIDHTVGLQMLVRIGDSVRRQQPLVKVFAWERGREEALARIRDALTITDEAVEPPRLIVERIEPVEAP